MKNFRKILVANRGEIAIRVFKACKELGISSVAIYSQDDENSLFRNKADESYEVGKNKKPVDAYLGMEEIIELAREKNVDAIHPGYGFLSENAEFARRCEAAGIAFIGPDHRMMEQMGDKISSKIVAASVGVPTIPGSGNAVASPEEAKGFADSCGYPIILKASAGGGGRGMRIVWREEDLLGEFTSARSEAEKAFGIDGIFIEKYLDQPKHIEVQVLGDNDGNILHLYERDCSIQRRHQKVIEFTPAITITQGQREKICEDALKLARAVNYKSAGTVEFLVDQAGNHYFIEMNTRLQVEHTVTEMVTGIDLVQAQIRIAEGYRLDSEEINIKSQEDVQCRGYSIQCRVTTEDPANSFAPDTGEIGVYRDSSGFGIRLDGGNGFTGAVIGPYYDSLLVKVISWSRSFHDAVNKCHRALEETTISGVKTNIGFLLNVLNHETFRRGLCHTGFIEAHPSLLTVSPQEAFVEDDVLFHGLEEGETYEVNLAQGHGFIIKLLEIRPPNDDGTRGLVLEVNGSLQMITVKDKAAFNQKNKMEDFLAADPGNQYEIGASIPGNIFKILVKEGEQIEAGTPIAVLEAMKMETNVLAPVAGRVSKIHGEEGQRVVAGQLIAVLE